jgi:hypothetical protein
MDKHYVVLGHKHSYSSLVVLLEETKICPKRMETWYKMVGRGTDAFAETLASMPTTNQDSVASVMANLSVQSPLQVIFDGQSLSN